MKKKLYALLCLSLFASAASAWPVNDISTTNMDDPLDDPSQARVDIMNAMTKMGEVIDARGAANGVAPLDATAQVPDSNIPDTLTFDDDSISGNKVDGGAISDFASTGIDDNATATAITIDVNENFGINTTDIEAWSSSYTAYQLDDLNAMASHKTNSRFDLLSNAYQDSGGYKYRSTGPATLLQHYDGEFYMYTAPSGTADTAVTWSADFTIRNNKQITLGPSSPFSTYGVTIDGAGNAIAAFVGDSAAGGTTVFRDANAGVTRGFVGYGSTLLSSATISDMIIRSESDLLLASGGNNRRVTIDGTTGDAEFTGNVTSTKSCDTGYTRVGPNKCIDKTPNYTSLARDACTSISAPAGAAHPIIKARAQSRAANSVGARETIIYIYSNSSCTTASDIVAVSKSYEFSALSAGTLLEGDSGESIGTIASGNVYVKMTDDGGNNGFGQVAVYGYYE